MLSGKRASSRFGNSSRFGKSFSPRKKQGAAPRAGTDDDELGPDLVRVRVRLRGRGRGRVRVRGRVS